MVNDEPLDPERIYSYAGTEYILKNNGDGFSMFHGEMLNLDRNIIDIDGLIEYIQHLNGSIPEEYSDPYGQWRIRFVD